MQNAYLGIDVGSVTTKCALVDEQGKYIDSTMLRTAGKPVVAVQAGMRNLLSQAKDEYNVLGVGTTGSGRNLAGALVGVKVGFDNQAQRFSAEIARLSKQNEEKNKEEEE